MLESLLYSQYDFKIPFNINKILASEGKNSLEQKIVVENQINIGTDKFIRFSGLLPVSCIS